MAGRAGIIAGGLVLALAGSAAAQEPFADGAFSSHTPDAARGAVIYNASGCATCHSVEGNLDLLAGGRAFENRLGKVYAPNITHDPVAGIGQWTDAEFLNALLRGVAPDGHSYYGAFFPYLAYARMKPEDALDLRAYLKTLPQSDAPSKEHEVNFFGRNALLLMDSQRPALTPPADPQIARGQYLVEALGHCGECHTPRSGLGLDEDAAFTGFLGYFGDFAPDISKERLETYGPAAFVTGTLANGLKLNGKPIGAASMLRIAAATAKLSMDDRAAMYAYLTNAPVDVSKLPAETIVAKAGDQGGVAPKPATPVAFDPVAAGRSTGSEGLMQIVAAACEETAPAPAASLAVAPPVAAGVPPEVERAADRVMDQSCRTCHGPGQRNDRTFPMHDIADLAADRSAVIPGNPDKSPLYQSIALNRMPLGTKLKAEELDAIRTWIMALGAAPATATPAATDAKAAATGKQTLPRYVGGDLTALTMAAVADLRSLEETDRPFIRYMSFANTPLPQIDCKAEGVLRNPMHYLHAGLNKFINSVSRGTRLATVKPVAGTEGTLVRIDLRDYGWSSDDWLSLTTGAYTHGATEAGFSPDSWADLATIYPYSIDPMSDDLTAVLANGTGAAVPILNASWFVHFASQSPFYDLLLRLPADIAELETRMGLDVTRLIQQGEVVRAGFVEGSSGVSDHNRMLERFDLTRNGYYWKSYDFAGSDNRQSLLQHPDGPVAAMPLISGTEPFEHDGGEMIFSLPNGMQGYYLSTAAGERLLVGPSSIVSFRNKPIGKGVEIVNARSCFDCHENGIIRKSDEIRSFIESSNRYTREQRDALLEMYVSPEDLEEHYTRDIAAFVSSLETIGAVQPSAAGIPVSLQAPTPAGGQEIVTFLADLQFENLDLQDIARAFFLTEDEFRERVKTMGDPHLMQTVDVWIRRIDDGLFVTRSEIEEVWSALLPRLTDFRPLGGTNVAFQPQSLAGNLEQAAALALAAELKAKAVPFTPPSTTELAPFNPVVKPADALQLQLSVPRVNVKVNDLLQFDVKATKRCELQVLYVEETRVVEDLPTEVIGPAFLEAGETRRIPFPGSGFQLRFDTPGRGETMVAFCREGGLGTKRITGAAAMAFAKERFQPLSRGIVIERTQQVAADNGLSATNVITFDVAP
ncbi:c-type cytochrome [Chthonobacter rhizosphaerae]|uniref:c-type cytochrome n=1 Tax=Chthonobacter rhizosphaerae TaxID=2735553 RepID=UPI0015EE8F37|nr:c-type cytochrome [Chthonobacter rhizosphaerae]